jgi:CBS domain-containing protein
MALCAEDVMQSKVRTVSPGMSLPDLERLFLETRVNGFPVVEKGRLVGVISHSDIVRQLAAEQSYAEYESDYYSHIGGFEEFDPVEPLNQVAARAGARLRDTTVGDMMSRSPVTVSAEDPVRDIARLMIERRIRRLPVVRDGRLIGVVASLDLVRLLAEERFVEA